VDASFSSVNEPLQSYPYYYGMARTCALLGPREEMISFLNKAYQQQVPELEVVCLLYDVVWEAWREDAEFKAV
jgi:hypothetical protein